MKNEQNESTAQFIKISRRLDETIAAYIKVINYFDSLDKETIEFKDKLIKMLNEDLQTIIKCFEEQIFILTDKLFVVNPQSEAYYKIKFDNSNSNPAPGENQEP